MRFNLRPTPCSGYQTFTAEDHEGPVYTVGAGRLSKQGARAWIDAAPDGPILYRCQHPLSSLKGDLMRMRVVVHYLVATVILTVYGGQV
jgi:hypothetical protein